VRRHHNGRPEILVSALPPASVSFVDGQHQACGGLWKLEQTRTGHCLECGKPLTGGQPMILCPDGCGRWVYVQRGKLKPNAGKISVAAGRSRCRPAA
jgi:hypothetical protein